MRARVFAFWLAFASASTSFAQDAAYKRFPAASSGVCATACTSDRMCASWSFGGASQTVESTSRRSKDNAPPTRMCALSLSPNATSMPGYESGLPRRTGLLASNNRFDGGSANYSVRPAPWLDPRSRMPDVTPAFNQGAPITPPPPPAPVPSAGRVDYLPQNPTSQAAPQPQKAQRAGARGKPRSRPSPEPTAAQVEAPAPEAEVQTFNPNPSLRSVRMIEPDPSPAPPVQQQQPDVLPASLPAAMQQDVQTQPTPQQASDLSKFRGADGMVDAAAMRRAQINSARATGQPAYAVQREWEAVEAERQRAAANGEVRQDPLAGTTPVQEAAPPKSSRQQSDEPVEPDPFLEEAAPAPAKPAAKAKGARGTPRADQLSKSRRAALAQAVRDRANNPSYIDREPRLGGGPGR